MKTAGCQVLRLWQRVGDLSECGNNPGGVGIPGSATYEQQCIGQVALFSEFHLLIIKESNNNNDNNNTSSSGGGSYPLLNTY